MYILIKNEVQEMATMHFQGTCLGGVFRNAKFLEKFDLKNVILTNTKDFSWEKMVQIRQISKRK